MVVLLSLKVSNGGSQKWLVFFPMSHPKIRAPPSLRINEGAVCMPFAVCNTLLRYFTAPLRSEQVCKTHAAKRPEQKGRMAGRRDAKRAAFFPFSCFRFSIVSHLFFILHTPRSFSTCLVSSFSFLASLCLFRIPIFTFHLFCCPSSRFKHT